MLSQRKENEPLEPISLLSSDPGVTSGYCYAVLWPKDRMIYYPFQMTDDVDNFWNRLCKFEPRYIIMESFEFRKGRQQSGINLFPKELIGVARLYELIATSPVAVYFQTASQGKGYYSNKTLSQLGFLERGDITGLAHGTDATRHLFQWITFGAGYQFNSPDKPLNEFAIRVDTWPEM